jgi:hypothetical protein
MGKKYVPKDAKNNILKDDLTERYKERHSNLGLVRGYSFSHHSHGRVNYHSIGFNHEPGTL